LKLNIRAREEKSGVAILYHDDRIYIREGMVQRLKSQGIHSGTVLQALLSVPRHFFVSDALGFSAYQETSLPIGFGQTISKPSIIALMVQALSLNGEERVLEIGTGSGYQTALLANLAQEIVTMERIGELLERARAQLISIGYGGITFIHSDDFRSAEGTFDRIIVAAGTDIMPPDLLQLLNTGGILLIPLGKNGNHVIKKYVKRLDGSVLEESIGEATFVPYVVESA
jgi:protein-L-isoaspartate(D-aspartate) O-methyltransferase